MVWDSLDSILPSGLKQFQLISSQLLPDYPSGSSINYYDEKLFLVGDDANDLLVLDKSYNSIKSYPLFTFSEKRIPKKLKTDLEAAVFVTIGNEEYLLLAGSASREIRERILVIPVIDRDLNAGQIQTISISLFIQRLREKNIAEINLEGMTVINDLLLLSNRGNQSNPVNHIIVTQLDFWKNQSEAQLRILPIEYSQHTEELLSVSELCFEQSTDTLLITFSTEATANAYDDGVIGNSYIGCIRNASQKIKESILRVDEMLNLPEEDDAFRGEKIEGICVEEVNEREMIIHLVSDNDLGASRLFKCAIKL